MFIFIPKCVSGGGMFWKELDNATISHCSDLAVIAGFRVHDHTMIPDTIIAESHIWRRFGGEDLQFSFTHRLSENSRTSTTVRWGVYGCQSRA